MEETFPVPNLKIIMGDLLYHIIAAQRNDEFHESSLSKIISRHLAKENPMPSEFIVYFLKLPSLKIWVCSPVYTWWE